MGSFFVSFAMQVQVSGVRTFWTVCCSLPLQLDPIQFSRDNACPPSFFF